MIQIAKYLDNYWLDITSIRNLKELNKYNVLITPDGKSYVSIKEYFSKKCNINIDYVKLNVDKDDSSIITLLFKNQSFHIKDFIEINEDITISEEQDHFTYICINIPISDIKEL